MESTRFPGKPLKDINGKPMIQWVFEAAERSAADDCFVATDSPEIIKAVEAFGGAAVLTSAEPVQWNRALYGSLGSLGSCSGKL